MLTRGFPRQLIAPLRYTELANTFVHFKLEPSKHFAIKFTDEEFFTSKDFSPSRRRETNESFIWKVSTESFREIPSRRAVVADFQRAGSFECQRLECLIKTLRLRKLFFLFKSFCINFSFDRCARLIRKRFMKL